MHTRQADGTIVARPTEITTVTGASPGYRLTGTGGNRETTVDAIVGAVTRKITSTPQRPSQLAVSMPNVESGGTLAVHLPRAGQNGAADVATAMTRLGPRPEGTPHAREIEFFVPGAPPLRYVRQPDGSYTQAP